MDKPTIYHLNEIVCVNNCLNCDAPIIINKNNCDVNKQNNDDDFEEDDQNDKNTCSYCQKNREYKIDIVNVQMYKMHIRYSSSKNMMAEAQLV